MIPEIKSEHASLNPGNQPEINDKTRTIHITQKSQGISLKLMKNNTTHTVFEQPRRAKIQGISPELMTKQHLLFEHFRDTAQNH
jgi:hypothetical protein